MALDQREKEKLLELLSALRDEELTAQNSEALEEMLAGSAEAREEYLRMIDLHAALHWRYSLDGSGKADPISPAPQSEQDQRLTENRLFARPGLLSMTVAAIVIGLLLTVMALITSPIYRAVTHVDVVEPAQTVATVTGIYRPDWAQPMQSMGLAKGQSIELNRGRAEITFQSGATVVIEGPSSLRLVGDSECRLSRGRLTARVPEAARGFVVQTPTAIVRDLGTEFALSVDESDTSFAVFEGSIEVERPGAVPKRLNAGQMAELSEAKGLTVSAPIQPRDAGAIQSLLRYDRIVSADPRSIGAYTIGYLFEVGDKPLLVSHLGVQDVHAVADSAEADDPLIGFADDDGFHQEAQDRPEARQGLQVGLWTADGQTLVASASVRNADPCFGSWRYVELNGEPVVLNPRARYLIGAYVGGGIEWFLDADRMGRLPFLTGQGITILENRYRTDEFGPPLTDGQGPVGRWGACNALFQVLPLPKPPVGS